MTHAAFRWIALAAAMVVSPAANAQLIIAHRGASHDAPENTLAAFRLAFKQGADGIECDLYLTSDGRIICTHDKDTQRVAGVKHVVKDTPFAELRKLDAGAWKDPKWRGERLPTLEEIIATVPKGKKIFIELKTGPEIVDELFKTLDASSLEPEQIVIISFQADAIAECEKRRPELKTYWLVSYKQDDAGRWSPKFDEVLDTLERIKTDGLNSQAEQAVVDDQFVEKLCDAGLCDFAVWTVDKPRTARYYKELGAQAITTNRPAFIRRQISRQPAAAAPAG